MVGIIRCRSLAYIYNIRTYYPSLLVPAPTQLKNTTGQLASKLIYINTH